MQYVFEVVLDRPFNRSVLITANDVVEAGTKVATSFEKRGYNRDHILDWIVEINRLKHEFIE